ncbi:uncharacterized protein LALA0_S01e12772g [Lachancea lanzarotensis]|uniref:LALA0S01e12772g1_1 n=1 Tax=Lachancea lanzarotensis TaxID=1245769 RepID=A0A0C7N1W2_9SACH|nr:uncharacterized protein LALA0_S01e12772g [Lachancea lanzarotensis]CEP60519.1 LALA0S01e12772g1_1 [Lachancea lanzarotensis]
MVDALDIPGFYFDTEKKRYFKISQNATSSSNQTYGRDELKKRSDQQQNEIKREAAVERRQQGVRGYEFMLSNPLHVLFSADNSDLSGSQSRMGYNVARQDREQDRGSIRKDNVWSDVTPLLGAIAQQAVAICCLPKANGFLIVTHRMNVVFISEDRTPIYLYQSSKTEEFELESLRTRLREDQFSLIVKAKVKNCYSLLHIKLDSPASPQVFRISVCPELNSEIRDAVFVGANTCVWLAQGNEVLALELKEGCSTYTLSASRRRLKRKRREESNVMCVEVELHRPYSNMSAPIGWCGTRSGMLSRVNPYRTLSTLSFASMGNFEGLSILSIKELGESHLLLSGIKSEEQVLAIVRKDKSANDGHQPTILTMLKTSVRNLVKETELISTSADGRFILYGRRNMGCVNGALELFSSRAMDNFVRQHEVKARPVTYHPLRTLAEILPFDWHKSFDKLLYAELQEVTRGQLYYGESIDSNGIRIAAFTKDIDVAGINFKSFPLDGY